MQTEYNYEGGVITSSVTDVAVNMISGEQTGPTPTSAYSSLEEEELLKEEIIQVSSLGTVQRMDVNGGVNIISDQEIGTVYTGVENLTLDEFRTYLEDHYSIDAQNAFYVSFESDFLDVRGIIGGRIRFTSGGVASNTEVYKLDSSLTKVSLHDSGLLNAMQDTPFRVSGISMSWSGEDTPKVAIALCQLI